MLKLGVAAVNPDADDNIDISAVEQQPVGDGIRFGRISNIDDIAETLQRAVSDIEQRPGVRPGKVTGVFVALGGRTLGTVRASASITLPDETTISQAIVERLENDACKAFVPENREILDIIPMKYVIDGLSTSRPAGTVGKHIDAEFTLVVCDPRNARNIETVVKDRLNLNICGYIIRPLALARLCLSPEDTYPGCMLVDVGAETTTLAIFKNCVLQYIATLPLGSQHITNDLASGLSISQTEAEKIKLTLANAMPDTDSSTVEQFNIDNYVTARVKEIAANIIAYIGFGGLRISDLGGGIVLCGRGAKLKNFGRMLQSLSGLKVRNASPMTRFNISDSSVVAGDCLDLLALVNDATLMVQDSPDGMGCLSYSDEYLEDMARRQHEQTAGPKSSDDGINQPAREKKEEKTMEEEKTVFEGLSYNDSTDNAYDGISSPFANDSYPSDSHVSTTPQVSIHIDSEDFDDEDPYLLDDSDSEEAARQRDKLREQANREKMLRRQKEKENREKERARINAEKKNRVSQTSVILNRIKIGLSNIFTDEPDDDADLDAVIDRDMPQQSPKKTNSRQ